jgi:hypothetical protein
MATKSYSVETIIRYTDSEGVEKRISGPTYARTDLTYLEVAKAIPIPAAGVQILWDPRNWGGYVPQTFNLLEIWYEDPLVSSVLLELTNNEGDAAETIAVYELVSGARFVLGSQNGTFGVAAAGDGFTRYGTNPDVWDKIRAKNLDAGDAVTLYMTMGRV